MQYAQTWLAQIEADPRGGTIGGFYRALFHAVTCRPLIAAMLRRDRRVIGNYLRKRDNLFAQMYSEVNTPGFFLALQSAGAIRQDIDAAVILHIVEMLSYGQLTIGDFKPPDQFPPYDAVMEAGRHDDRALCRQMAATARRVKPSSGKLPLRHAPKWSGSNKHRT
jgi:TetR/AcrR family acrAB operon transcriptional repressor